MNVCSVLRHVRVLLRVITIGCGLLMAGCGNGDADHAVSQTPVGGQSPTPWTRIQLKGVRNATGMAILGDDLLICSGERKRVMHVAPLAQVFSTPAGQSRAVTTREVPLDIRESSPVNGRGALARSGHGVGAFLDSGYAFADVAVQGNGTVFVAERKKRLVLWGNATRTPAGELGGVSLLRAFVVPGADRREQDKLNWDDFGPGISGLLSVHLRRKTEDLYVVAKKDTPSAKMPPGGSHMASKKSPRIQVRAMDRGGQPLDYFFIDPSPMAQPEVMDLSWHDGRFVLLLGGKRGALAFVRPPQPFRTATLGRPVPAPEPPEGASWQSLTHDVEGRMLLLSNGEHAELVWREP